MPLGDFYLDQIESEYVISAIRRILNNNPISDYKVICDQVSDIRYKQPPKFSLENKTPTLEQLWKEVVG